jgi:Flp pilus assembly pilin Flp
MNMKFINIGNSTTAARKPRLGESWSSLAVRIGLPPRADPGGQDMKALLKRLVRETDGQDLIEYALLASVIALGVTAAMMFLRNQLTTEFSNIGNSITAGS